MSVDIRELQELIEGERVAEEKVRRAKEEAQAILKTAREKAESIIQAIDSDPNWEKLRQARKEEITRKMGEVEEGHRQKISLIERSAQENFEKAIAHVVKWILSVEI